MSWVRSYFLDLLGTDTAKKGLFAVLDQGVYSGTNFLVGVLVARHLPKDEFGTFVIFYAFPAFLIGFQSSLISGPMLVLGSSRGSDEQSYFSSLFQGQVFVSILVACSLLVLYVVSLNVNLGFHRSALFLSLALVHVMMSAHEFVRRLFLTKGRTLELFINDSVLAVVEAFLVISLFWWGQSAGVLPTAEIVLGCIAIAFAVSSIIGIWQLLALVSVRPSTKAMLMYLRENWQFGRWLLGTHIGGTAFSQLTIWIVALFGGSVAAANLEATRLVVAPAQVLLFAAGNYLTPVASQKFTSGGAASLRRFIEKLAPMWIGAFLVYLFVALLGSDALLSFLYGDKYSNSIDTVLVWVLVFFALGLKQLPGTALIAMRRPDLCMGITLIAGIITVILTVWLTLIGGETWAVVARLVGELILFAAFLWYAMKFTNR